MENRGRRPNVKRQRRAAALRARGLTYQAVGDHLGVTAARAYRLTTAFHGTRPPPRRPLSVQLILSWAEAHFQKTGTRPAASEPA